MADDPSINIDPGPARIEKADANLLVVDIIKDVVPDLASSPTRAGERIERSSLSRSCS